MSASFGHTMVSVRDAGRADVLSPDDTWRVNIDPQIAAVKAARGAVSVEEQLLGVAFSGPPAPTSTPGVNATKRLALASVTQTAGCAQI